MKRIYYLSTCSTCKRILKDLGDKTQSFELIDIKSDPLDEKQVEELAAIAGSYQALFSRTARKYKELGLKDKKLDEKDYKHYLLEHYTFLKRPVLVEGNKIFIGSRAVQKYADGAN
ncbi:MAG: ArsC/Spx/MgsR family protein [Chitinophagales bacterium]